MSMSTKEAVSISGRSRSWLQRHTCAWCDQTLLRSLVCGCGSIYGPDCNPTKKDFSDKARLKQ